MSTVAFIVSVYYKDQPSWLERALDSIANQTYQCIRIYICKDGPLTTELDAVIERFCCCFENVIVVSNDSNLGLAKSLNKLIDVLILNNDVEFVARMDSDDISFPQRIERQIFFMRSNNVEVCGSYCREFGASYSLEEKRVPVNHDDIMRFSITRCPFIHPTVIFNIDIFRNGLRYPVDTFYTEDMAFWFLLIQQGYKMGNVPEILLSYRLDENAVIRRLGWKKSLCEFKLRLRYMYQFKQFTPINLIMLLSRLPFHILPVFVVKFLYKYAR